jgi:hypothetical protein
MPSLSSIGTGAKNLIVGGANQTLSGTGNLSGIEVPKHSDFYNALSSIDMALSLQSYWLAFIDVDSDYVVNDQGLIGDLKSAVTNKLTALDNQFGGFGGTLVDSYTNKDAEMIFSPNGSTPHMNFQGNKQTNKIYNKFIKKPEQLMFLVQGVNIPGDRFAVGTTPLQNVGGFVPHPIGGPRQDLDRLQMSFLENNASVTDLIMRPWMISASYDSLKLAKSADIVFFKLARHETGFKVTKRFDFKHAVPVAIDSEDYNYDPTSNITRRTVEFIYRSYVVADGDDLHDSLFDRLLSIGVDAGTKYVKNLIHDEITMPLSDFTNDLYSKAKDLQFEYTTSYTKITPKTNDTIDNPPNRVNISTVQAKETLRTILPKDSGADTVNSNNIPYKTVEVNK